MSVIITVSSIMRIIILPLLITTRFIIHYQQYHQPRLHFILVIFPRSVFLGVACCHLFMGKGMVEPPSWSMIDAWNVDMRIVGAEGDRS